MSYYAHKDTENSAYFYLYDNTYCDEPLDRYLIRVVPDDIKNKNWWVSLS